MTVAKVSIFAALALRRVSLLKRVGGFAKQAARQNDGVMLLINLVLAARPQLRGYPTVWQFALIHGFGNTPSNRESQHGLQAISLAPELAAIGSRL
jgi:hypothetical protein